VDLILCGDCDRDEDPEPQLSGMGPPFGPVERRGGNSLSAPVKTLA